MVSATGRERKSWWKRFWILLVAVGIVVVAAIVGGMLAGVR